ncbi:exo-alpha-sialidase [Paenibacillus hemerocallicola]|uniref:Exo-alpha-sialidase n=1 Tax=Paenibacillus hemerocallicola TaxID=1172614 RepID=A0A5C4TB00_9BACL|nr:sialidase family protein [Paenibacillus hemerocallicola]TNJ66062.1 exo-alpha-sialidase [Paenibacillus hemerocallicola]
MNRPLHSKGDLRNIATGIGLPKKHYCDQPYTIVAGNGNWLCILTTGSGKEGDSDQHIVATISTDEGRTWSGLIDIEPPGPPESSWVTPFVAPSGRVYVFYTYNGKNMREVLGSTLYARKRVDTLGDIAFKYSDDLGYTWSKECCYAYSRDDGHTWTAPAHAVYTPGGRKIKHPRVANFVRKLSNGNYLLWYHNHGKNNRNSPSSAYADRNPAWFAGGIKKDGFIHWSKPEIVLYDDNPNTRYPGFLETADGRFFIMETQKTIARIHQVDRCLRTTEAVGNYRAGPAPACDSEVD